MPLRPRGLLLAALAAASLGIGIARADLAALFWGSGFLLLAAYAGIGAIAQRLALRRRARSDPAFVSIALPSGGLAPGSLAEARLATSLPRRLAPGFAARLILRPTWHGRTLGPIAAELAPGRSVTSVAFRAARRGVYAVSEAEVEVSDVLGLARSSLLVPVRETVRVHPCAAPRGGPRREPGDGADAPHYERRRQRSEELLEVREYVAGDDVRRINWKLLAHAGRLLLRIGEETPPPRSRLLLVLDTSRPSAPAPAADDDLLDALVDQCASAALQLRSRGVELMLARPGEPLARAPSGTADLLGWMADAWWTAAEEPIDLPKQKRLRALIFSLPGSTGLARLLAELRGRGWQTGLVPVEPRPSRPRKRSLVRELLLVPEARP